jgi:ABC-type transport system involved in multi-copper enzyme maturation permease subunit
MNDFLRGTGVIFSLEMRQRVRGVAWWVLLGVFFGILLIVTVVVSIIVFGGSVDPTTRGQLGGPVYSLVIYFVLLLGTLVAPAMSGNAINGDRDAGTLATTQITLVTTGQLIAGKFLAAWVTAFGFLVVSLPFLIFAALSGGVPALTILVSVLILALELGVVAALGVGLSGLITRPLFSVVVTYLAVAALSVGTLIAFTLGGLALQTKVTDYSYDNTHRTSQTCTGLHSYKSTVPRFDLVWGTLVANPYVLLADAVPATYDHNGNPTDLFGQLKYGARVAQISPLDQYTPTQACKAELNDYVSTDSARHVINSTAPGWAVGILIQLVLAAAALWGAWMKTRTPARRLARGSRVA